MEIDMDNCYNTCKYFIDEDATDIQYDNFVQSISKLLNKDDIKRRFKIRQILLSKITHLRKIINEILKKFKVVSDDIKTNMNDTVDKFENMFLNTNEVTNEDSIVECVAILNYSIYLTNECVKKYIINTIIKLTEHIDNNENTQGTVIKICEIKFNSFNSFVENYKDAFVLIGTLKEKYMKQSKKNQ